MTERRREKWYKTKVVGCLIWGMPWAVSGITLCASGIGAPLGVIALAIAGAPLAKQQAGVVRRNREWQERDRPMEQPEGILPPWLTEGMLDREVYENAQSSEPDA